jgi:hypothetical protein
MVLLAFAVFFAGSAGLLIIASSGMTWQPVYRKPYGRNMLIISCLWWRRFHQRLMKSFAYVCGWGQVVIAVAIFGITKKVRAAG